jgi:hypothetical protein
LENRSGGLSTAKMQREKSPSSTDPSRNGSSGLWEAVLQSWRIRAASARRLQDQSWAIIGNKGWQITALLLIFRMES